MRVQNITTEFDVKIKFPEKSLSTGEAELDQVNGQSVDGESNDHSPKPCDLIRITGVGIKCVLCRKHDLHSVSFRAPG